MLSLDILLSKMLILNEMINVSYGIKTNLYIIVCLKSTNEKKKDIILQ